MEPALYLDPLALEKLTHTAGEDLALQLLERCLAFDCCGLDRVVSAGDLHLAEEMLHRLTSDSGWLGALELHRLCQALEIQACDRQADELARLLPEFLDVYRATATLLESHRSRLQGP